MTQAEQAEQALLKGEEYPIDDFETVHVDEIVDNVLEKIEKHIINVKLNGPSYSEELALLFSGNSEAQIYFRELWEEAVSEKIDELVSDGKLDNGE